MPAARIKKTPAITRTRAIGRRLCTKAETSAAKTGVKNITGSVPSTKPSITSAPSAPLPVIPAAASADASVIQGNSAVIRPKAKKPNPRRRHRPESTINFEAKRVTISMDQTISRFMINEIPCTTKTTANKSVTIEPAPGSKPAICAETSPENTPTAAPADTYDVIRPRLYSEVAYHVAPRPIDGPTSFAQTRGPHIMLQCHDITKLNHVTESIVPTSKTSTVWSKCSK